MVQVAFRPAPLGFHHGGGARLECISKSPMARFAYGGL
jgi:hypothetical protein